MQNNSKNIFQIKNLDYISTVNKSKHLIMDSISDFKRATDLLNSHQGFITAALTGLANLKESSDEMADALSELQIGLSIQEWTPDEAKKPYTPCLCIALYANDPEGEEEDNYIGQAYLDLHQTEFDFLTDLQNPQFLAHLFHKIFEERMQQDAIDELMASTNDNSIN